MCFCVVDKEQVFSPLSSEFVKELDKLLCALLFGETENEAAFAARAKDIGAFICVIDFHDGAAAPSSPAAADERDESKGRFILRAHNKPFGSIVARLSSSFFLKRKSSSLLGC